MWQPSENAAPTSGTDPEKGRSRPSLGFAALRHPARQAIPLRAKPSDLPGRKNKRPRTMKCGALPRPQSVVTGWGLPPKDDLSSPIDREPFQQGFVINLAPQFSLRLIPILPSADGDCAPTARREESASADASGRTGRSTALSNRARHGSWHFLGRIHQWRLAPAPRSFGIRGKSPTTAAGCGWS